MGWCDPRRSLSRRPPGSAGEGGRLRPAGMEPDTEPPGSAEELCAVRGIWELLFGSFGPVEVGETGLRGALNPAGSQGYEVSGSS